jgi:hypothetical protein
MKNEEVVRACSTHEIEMHATARRKCTQMKGRFGLRSPGLEYGLIAGHYEHSAELANIQILHEFLD